MRHIKDQPPLEQGDGPIGLLMAPTRELVQQISKVDLTIYPFIFCHQKISLVSCFLTIQTLFAGDQEVCTSPGSDLCSCVWRIWGSESN